MGYAWRTEEIASLPPTQPKEKNRTGKTRQTNMHMNDAADTKVEVPDHT